MVEQNNAGNNGALFLSPFLLLRHFEVKSRGEPTDAAALFSVPDFVGDACKAIASRVRGAVASVQFDDFHKVSISRLVLLSPYFMFVSYSEHFKPMSETGFISRMCQRHN